MLNLYRFLFVAVGSLFLFSSNEQNQKPKNVSAQSRVNIESVTKVSVAKDGSAYLVTFRYDFDKFSTIYIEGFGTVPSKGTYQYISNQPYLDFLDPDSRGLIERVPLQETTIVAAKPPLNEIPSDNQFSQGFHSYAWELPSSLQERANAVLAKYFIYYPHENNKLIYLTTTYTPLSLSKKLSDDGVLAEVALLLSFPFDPANGKYSFHVQYSVKEGRVLSDELRPTDSSEIIQAANKFADKIVAEMKAGK
jgi:hypothetical protein